MSTSTREVPGGRLVAIALLALGGAVAAAPAPARACGPEFPNRLLETPDAVLLSAPAADLNRELALLGVAPAARFVINIPGSLADCEAETRRIEADDLDRALAATGTAPASRQAAVARLANARAAGEPALLTDLQPAELREYAMGAIAFKNGDITRARAHWRTLLELPPTARRQRSVWAAYMLGRSSWWRGFMGTMRDPADGEHSVAEALRWLAEARRLAAEGFEDRLGLAATSYGWEAALHRDQGHLDEAVTSYLAQLQAGESGAVLSLGWLARDLLAAPERLRELAQSPVVRPVITAYLLATPSWDLDVEGGRPRAEAERWLEALEAAGVRDVPGADRLAWLAYRLGRYEQAARWLEVAPADAAVALWTRARLALRRGELARAAELLAQVVRGFDEHERWRYPESDDGALGAYGDELQPAGRARAELGLIALSRGEFVRALDLLLRTDYATDAAYLAERVVSVDELKALVDERWPAPPVIPADPRVPPALADDVTATATYARTPEEGPWIRYLLGRRLARAGRLAEAAPYLPDAPRARLEAYAAALATARDRERPAAQRAAAWWEAAKVARHDGMEIMGTEVYPDWQFYNGGTSRDAATTYRTRAISHVAPPKKSELALAKKNAPVPDKRFHYRYVAGEHVWQAVKLLPPEAPEAAAMLCHAARWVLNRDPPAAQRFYKEYLRRSRHYEESIPSFGSYCPDEP